MVKGNIQQEYNNRCMAVVRGGRRENIPKSGAKFFCIVYSIGLFEFQIL